MLYCSHLISGGVRTDLSTSTKLGLFMLEMALVKAPYKKGTDVKEYRPVNPTLRLTT